MQDGILFSIWLNTWKLSSQESSYDQVSQEAFLRGKPKMEMLHIPRKLIPLLSLVKSEKNYGNCWDLYSKSHVSPAGTNLFLKKIAVITTKASMFFKMSAFLKVYWVQDHLNHCWSSSEPNSPLWHWWKELFFTSYTPHCGQGMTTTSNPSWFGTICSWSWSPRLYSDIGRTEGQEGALVLVGSNQESTKSGRFY